MPRWVMVSKGSSVRDRQRAYREEGRMRELLEVAGVRVPSASVLLYSAFPDNYPTLDVSVLESLGVKPRSQYPVGFWLDYLRVCREAARRHRVGHRALDK